MRIKKLYIFVLLFIFLVILGGIIYFFLRKEKISQEEFDTPLAEENREENNIFRSLIQNRKNLANPEECKKLTRERSEEECISWYYREKAQTEGDISFCKEIPLVKSSERCVFDIALQKEDISLCDSIGDASTKTSCRDTVVEKKSEKTFEECSQISTPLGQGNCIRDVFSRLRSTEECGIYKESDFENMCIWVVTTRTAYEKSDIALCDSLQEISSQESCRDPFVENTALIGDLDKDKDGLSYEEEMNFGTSDDKKDTDGDGFDDKTEIEKGYNPLGEGKL